MTRFFSCSVHSAEYQERHTHADVLTDAVYHAEIRPETDMPR